MPSDMYLRGKHDAEADALDESYYHYYYDYRLAYDEVLRLRRRSRIRLLLGRVGRYAAVFVPLIILVGGAWFYSQYKPGKSILGSLGRRTPTATPYATPRPTLIPPTPMPPATPTPELALRANAFAVITGTSDAPLRVHTRPGRDAPAPGRLDPGQRVEIMGGPEQADGITWWKVRTSEIEGWAAGQFLAPVAHK